MSWSEVSVAGGAAQAAGAQPRRSATAGINLMIGGVQRSKLFPAFRFPRVPIGRTRPQNHAGIKNTPLPPNEARGVRGGRRRLSIRGLRLTITGAGSQP